MTKTMTADDLKLKRCSILQGDIGQTLMVHIYGTQGRVRPHLCGDSQLCGTIAPRGHLSRMESTGNRCKGSIVECSYQDSCGYGDSEEQKVRGRKRKDVKENDSGPEKVRVNT